LKGEAQQIIKGRGARAGFYGPPLIHTTTKLKIPSNNAPGHVRWVTCNHGMARPQVTDGGDGLQIWRVPANILNKQSRTADKGWSSSLGVGSQIFGKDYNKPKPDSGEN
jgi:hypothetical protein